MYTADQVETALCIWECYVDTLARGKSTSVFPEIRAYQDRHGIAETRRQLTRLAIVDACDAAWRQAASYGYEDCFDWEFVPWFLKHCIAYREVWPFEPKSEYKEIVQQTFHKQ